MKNLNKDRVPKKQAEFILSVSLGETNELQGKLEFVPTGERASFNGVLDMLELMQNKLDNYGVPQTTAKLRSWDRE
ncbi:MAG: hypothetical protein ACM3QW_10565 [Ignavibacteriales bacterium]